MRSFILVLFIIPYLSFSQERYYSLTTNTGATLSSVGGFSSFSSSCSNVTVTDTIRGGIFVLYTGADTADNGTIFKDAINRKWIRQYNQSTINAAWYGMIADDVTDQLPLFKRILSIMNAKALQTTGGYNYYRDSRTLFVPGSSSYYYFSDSILLPNTITLVGEGAYQNISTKFLFPAHKTGIATQPIDTSYYTNTVGTVIKNITVHQYVTAPYDTTKHGFNITSKVHLINCFADGWEGDGFHVVAPYNNNHGNADLTIIENCGAYNCFNGLYLQGADANLVNVTNFNSIGNVRWGVWDKGFLGNNYINCHTASNCINPRQKSIAKRNNLEYYARHDGYLKDPGVTVGWESDWVLIGDSTKFIYGNSPAYNAGTYYLVGGAYAIDLQDPVAMAGGENAYATLVGCYSEGDQPGSYFGQRVVVLNGDMAATAYKSHANLMASANQLVSNSPISSGETNLTYASSLGRDYVRIKSNTDGIDFGYNATTKTGYIKELSSANQPVQVITGQTPAATYGRTYLYPGNLINTRGIYVGRNDDATQIKYFGISASKPTSGTWSTGDIILKYTSTSNDTLGWRCTSGGTPGTWDYIPYPTAGSGVSQSTLNDSTAALRTTINTKQDALGSNSVTNNMLAGSISTSKITNYVGYAINVQALTSSPTDAQTVFFGNLPKAPVTAAATSKIYVRQAGTLTAAEIYCYSGTAGTNEAWSLYVRVNNTTDYLIQTVSASTNERVFSNTSLNISLNVGDYFEIKGVQPTWATNPLTTIYGGYVRIN